MMNFLRGMRRPLRPLSDATLFPNRPSRFHGTQNYTEVYLVGVEQYFPLLEENLLHSLELDFVLLLQRQEDSSHDAWLVEQREISWHPIMGGRGTAMVNFVYRL